MNRLVLFFFCLIFSSVDLGAHPGVGIVMDSKGNVFYTDLSHVWKISNNGELSIAVKNVHTHELYIDEEDNLYGEHEWYEGEATDKWGNYVWCLGNDGIFEKTIQDVEGFLDDNTLVRDNENSTYWAEKTGDHELLIKQTSSGDRLSVTEHTFTDIRWMHYSKHDNNLYVVDHLKIKKVTLEGDVTVVSDALKESGISFGGVEDRHYIFGLWSDQEMNLYVAVYGAGKVKKISPDGEITTIFQSNTFWAPAAGLIAPDGTHWIMEFSKRNRTRVRKIPRDGKHTIYKS
ncbi:hypothetical protein [uncultured Eudoraea sp.]|uniref:hypothetical protein n=1 Tax=uncultured Eudoraea sp. TaxID=1035614 RepID=UPI0026018453|nr:hypothetical protein [uncultured Eudoraea sp.]